MNARRLLFAGLAGAVLLAAGGCYRPAVKGVRDVAPAAIRVRVGSARAVNLPLAQTVAGTVRPVDRAVVSARIMGAAMRADFAVGQPFAVGETVVELDADEIAARLERAEASLAQVTRELERETGLRDQGVSPAEAVRALEDRRRVAGAAVREARALLGYTRVVAPFAGRITRKWVQTGDLAAPGGALFEIEGTGRMCVELEVPASLPCPLIGTGLPVVFDDGASTVGTLVEMSPAADPTTRTRLAKLDLPGGESAARSGGFARVSWPAGEAAALTVPIAALGAFGQMERVFVVKNNRAVLRLVKSGGVVGPAVSAIEGRIQSGLEAGESVILEAPADLRDGAEVEIVP